MIPRATRFLRRWLAPKELSSERVARYYDAWNERYMAAFGDTFQSQRTTDLGELFAHIADQAELAPGMRVLDAGCGIGGPALWLARHRGVSVAALNISGVQVAEARARVAAAGMESRVVVTQGDFHRLEELYPPESFDAVLYLESLVHSDHPQVALASALRVLKPGGVLYAKDLFQRDRIPDRRERPRVRRVVANVNRQRPWHASEASIDQRKASAPAPCGQPFTTGSRRSGSAMPGRRTWHGNQRVLFSNLS